MSERKILLKSQKTSVSFVVKTDEESLKALAELARALSYHSSSYDVGETRVLMRREEWGDLRIEVEGLDVAIVYKIQDYEWQPRFMGDEWGELEPVVKTAILFVIHRTIFLSFEQRLYCFERDEAEEKLKELGLPITLP
jgi:hypothetical protein